MIKVIDRPEWNLKIALAAGRKRVGRLSRGRRRETAVRKGSVPKPATRTTCKKT